MLCLSVTANAADSDRGKLVYENHCTGCHDSIVHIRDNHKAKSPEQIRIEVARWARNQNLQWGAAEIDDVTDYIDENFYL